MKNICIPLFASALLLTSCFSDTKDVNNQINNTLWSATFTLNESTDSQSGLNLTITLEGT